VRLVPIGLKPAWIKAEVLRYRCNGCGATLEFSPLRIDLLCRVKNARYSRSYTPRYKQSSGCRAWRNGVSERSAVSLPNHREGSIPFAHSWIINNLQISASKLGFQTIFFGGRLAAPAPSMTVEGRASQSSLSEEQGAISLPTRRIGLPQHVARAYLHAMENPYLTGTKRSSWTVAPP